MIKHPTMPLGAGPLYTNAIMGQRPSKAERECARQASSTILREDSIRVEESENVSTTDSWSMHFDCMDQPPYSSTARSDMIPREDLPKPKKESPLYELTVFLRDTGPLPPHRRPSKIEHPSQANARRRKAMQFLKLKIQNHHREHGAEEQLLCADLRDEGGLLMDSAEQPIPKGYEQKVSSAGKKYLVLQDPKPATHCDMTPSIQKHVNSSTNSWVMLTLDSPSVVESRVSICFTDGINPTAGSRCRQPERNVALSEKHIHPAWRRHYKVSSVDAEAVFGAIDLSSTPIRPPASDPPTPEPLSAISFTDSFRSHDSQLPRKSLIDLPWPYKKEQSHAPRSSSLPLLQAFDSSPHGPMHHPVRGVDVEIKHPLPRRFASHTALLHRSSTISSYRRGFTDSPGPPPRSPLRLQQRESRNIEDIITSYDYERPHARVAPAISGIDDARVGLHPIRPTVVTECTGPIKRPKSRGGKTRQLPPSSAIHQRREEQTRARKLRDRPVTNLNTPTPSTRMIDAVVHAPLPTPRQRLRKTRPQLQIPDRGGASRTPKPPSVASSEVSGKKISESTRIPVSAVPSADTPTANGEKTGYTPISPTTSSGSVTAAANMAFSPVMLVAEEVPIPKVKASSKPARIVKSYAPRPRSASIPRSAMKRRSRGGHTPSKPGSPSHEYAADMAPPLPSPPPNRALPPTPPASEPEKAKLSKLRAMRHQEKELPSVPTEDFPADTATVDQQEPLSGMSTRIAASRIQRKPEPPAPTTTDNDIKARLEALERQNALLSAALTKVFQDQEQAHGQLHDPSHPLAQRRPFAWQSRMARRSAASHAPPNSNDGGTKLHLNTSRGI